MNSSSFNVFSDYAVDIFHSALKDGNFECNLTKDTRLPMIYIDDVIKATADIIDAPEEILKIRTYNLGRCSYSFIWPLCLFYLPSVFISLF